MCVCCVFVLCVYMFEKGGGGLDFTHGMLLGYSTHKRPANSGNAHTRVLFGVKLLFDLIIC